MTAYSANNQLPSPSPQKSRALTQIQLGDIERKFGRDSIENLFAGDKKMKTKSEGLIKKARIPLSRLHSITSNVSSSVREITDTMRKISMAKEYENFYNQMTNKKYFGIHIGVQPIMIVRDPQLVMKILVQDFHHFTDRGLHANENDLLGNNMFFVRNPKWRILRQKVVPAFSTTKLKAMFELLESSCTDLITYLGDTNMVVYGAKKLMSDVTTDIICKTICGIDPDRTHVEMQKMAFAPSFRSQIRNIVNYTWPWLAKKINVHSPSLDEYFRKMTWTAIESRKRNHVKRNDFIQLLAEVHDEEMARPLEERVISDDDIVSLVFSFLAAGFETTITTTSGVLNELAFHPQIQNKIREEIRKVFRKTDRKMNYDDLKELKFMEQVIAETLRRNPITSALFRECRQDYVIPGSSDVIEKGVSVHIPHFALHHDPKYWKNPELFDPSRFSEENISKIIPGTYLPFSEGPRMCPGKKFVMLVMKMILGKVLLEYKVYPCEQSKMKYDLVKNSLISPPEGPFLLKFKKIQDDRMLEFDAQYATSSIQTKKTPILIKFYHSFLRNRLTR